MNYTSIIQSSINNVDVIYPFNNIFDDCKCFELLVLCSISFEFGSFTDTQYFVIAAAALNNLAVRCLSIFFFH